MEKICKNCGIIFYVDEKHSHKKCCSKSCTSKLNWKDENYRQKIVNYHNDPIVKKRFTELTKEIQNRPEIKEKKSKFMKQFQNIPEVKKRNSEKTKEYQNRPDIKQKNRDQAKHHQNLLEIKEKNRKRQKTRWKDPEYRSYMLEIIRKNSNSEKFKQQHSQTMLDLWKTDSYVNNKNEGYFKTKSYSLPSGNIVKIQGYENIFLDNFFKNGGKEEDILINKKDIKEKIGIITYIEDEKLRRYFPDFFIISKNVIVEVKSIWTYEMDKKSINLKEEACLNRGFNFMLAIL